MKVARQDIARLRFSIIAALLMTLLGVACIVGSHYYLSTARNERNAAALRRADAQKRLEQVAEEEREIRQNLVHYKEMVATGMALEESRLDLIESITHIKNERRLFDIRYEIEPQRPLDYTGISRTAPVEMVASRMKLYMQLLHEEDLLRFLADLRGTERSYVSVRSCSMARVERSGPSLSVGPRLQSECQIDFIDLRQRPA